MKNYQLLSKNLFLVYNKELFLKSYHHYTFFFLTLFCIVSNPCSGQIKKLFTYPPVERSARLHKYMYKIGADTTILFKSLDSIKTEAKIQGDDLFLWYAEIYKANLKLLFHYKTAKTRVEFLKSKQDYFEKSPFKVIRGAYYFHLGNAFYEASNFEESFRLGFQALRIFDEVGYQNISEASFYLNRFFEFYYYFKDYKTALSYLKLAIKYNKFEIMGRSFLLNNEGMVYLKMGDYVNAKNKFRETIELAKKLNEEVYVGIANGNYGNVLRLEGKYAQALPHLYKDIAINIKELPDNSAYTCLYISDALIQLDSLDKAERYMKLAIQLNRYVQTGRFATFLYDSKAKYYLKKGQSDKALFYKDLLAKTQDSLLKVFDTRVLLRAESEMAAEKYLNNLENIEKEKDMAIWKRNLLIITIFIISVAVVYGLNQRRKREKAIQEAEQNRIKEQVAHATTQLEQYIENIRSKNELIEQMTEELGLQKKIPTDEAETHLESLYKRVILTEEDWHQFKTLFDQVYPSFIKNLHDKYQDISPADTRLLVLLKLNIRSKEMSYMLGVSIESLRKARYRLRKKLENMQADTNLVELIAKL